MFRHPRGPVAFTEHLVSNTRGLYFIAQFQAVWHLHVPYRKQSQPEQAARHLLTHNAKTVTARTSITNASAAQAEINTALGRLGTTRSEVSVRDASVTLAVEPQMLRQARAHEHRVRSQELANLTQEHELRRLQRFRDTVLTDPAAAMSYWFMQHPNQLDDAVYTQIATLVSKIADHDPSMSWLHIARILDSFIRDLDVGDKRALLKLLADKMILFGSHEMAQRLTAHLPTTTGNHEGRSSEPG
jgi:hypothetical protein